MIVIPENTVQHITVLNASKLVSNSRAIRMATLCAKQLHLHFCPLWALPSTIVSFAVDEAHVMPDSELVVLLDNSDEAGALGYHDVTPLGNPYAKVFCEEGDQLVTLSHECMEMVLDPECETYDLNPVDGKLYAREACDAVEDCTYPIDDGEQVSDFILPGFMGLQPRLQTERTGAQLLSYMGSIDKPFDTAVGGYQIVKDPKTGQVGQIYGNKRAMWRAAAKKHPAARTESRLRGEKRRLRCAA